MTFSQDEIDIIRQHSGLFLPPDQIAMLIGVDQVEFKTILKWKPDNPATIAYNQGKLDTVIAIRKQEIDLAKLGSPLAIELIANFILEQNAGEK